MTCALPDFFGFSVQLQRFYPKTVGFSPPYLQKRCTIYNKQTSFRKIPSVIYSEMEAPDPASGSMNSAKYQTLLRFSPSDLCNSCAQPCSESEWNFSIEDGVNGFKGHNSFQGKEPEKISKSGRVSYRRSINRVSFS